MWKKKKKKKKKKMLHVPKLIPFTEWAHNAHNVTVQRRQNVHFMPTLHRVKPCTDVASNLPAIILRSDVLIACNGLQQKFQHAEHFTCDLLITQLS